MEEQHGAGWNWSNIPLPEPHAGGLLLGALLHRLSPRRTGGRYPGVRLVGVGLIGSSLLLIAWAVRTMGDIEAECPSEIVSTGPYAYSRNPMYLAWTGLYAGLALVSKSFWLVVLLPAVVVSTHVTVRREERALERTFGGAYRSYRNSVPRYL